ncbi:MAG: ABC transporter permease, partial [Bacillota bacterium]
AARAGGASDLYIMLRHILPHVISPVVVRGTLGMGFTVLQAAGLSFIGLGAAPPAAEWGAMINEGRNLLVNGVWWVSTFPGIAIMLAVLGCNLLGDGVRDVLDPRGTTRAEL